MVQARTCKPVGERGPANWHCERSLFLCGEFLGLNVVGLLFFVGVFFPTFFRVGGRCSVGAIERTRHASCLFF